jgi:glutathione S-transferase
VATPMPAATLYALPASHPCAAVALAMRLKGVDFRRVDMIPVVSKVQQFARFRGFTVPAVEFADGEKVLGSREIVRALEHRAPDPPMLPMDGRERRGVEEAERWGDEVLQPLVRRLTWTALKRRPGAIPSYQEASQLPRLPRPVLRVVAPGVIAIERRMIGATADAVRSDLRALPGHLDHVDDLIARGVIGSDPDRPNAADLQIGSSLRLLATIGDARPMLDGRPAADLAMRLFGDFPGNVPAGALPADWLRTG